MGLEEQAYYELAVLYASDIGEEVSYEVLEYAVLTACIRHFIRGVSASFLEETVDSLSMSNKIDL